jgi:predicted hotdog family 3-hydroxylacyl-ACP dehydratase
MTESYRIDQVLPHEGRMRFLDELLAYGDHGVTAALTIRTDSVLCDGARGVPAWVGMEYMAQTACIYSGVRDLKAGGPPGISALLGTRSYRAHVPAFAIGTRLIVDARLLVSDDDDLAVFDCSIRDAATQKELSVGDIKAIRPANIHELLKEQSRG